MGGKRIVLLSAREHYIAHFLLYKHYKCNGNKNEKIKSSRAFNCMTFQSNDNIKRYNSHSFEFARKAHYNSMCGDNHPFRINGIPENFGESIANGMKKLTIEWRLSAAENMKNVRSLITEEQELKRRETVSDMCKNRIGDKNPNYGKTLSEETRKKQSESMLGKNNSKEHNKNISLGWDKRTIVECFYCGKTSKNAANMKRWHFDNCKSKGEI